MPFSKPCLDNADEAPFDESAVARPTLGYGTCPFVALQFGVTLLTALIVLAVWSHRSSMHGDVFVSATLALAFLGAAFLHAWLHQRASRGFQPAIVLAEQLEPLLDQMPDGLVITDQHDRIVVANQAFVQSLNVTKKSLVGRRASSLPWILGAAKAKSDFPRVRANHQTKSNAQQLMRYRLPDGQERFFSINSSPVKAKDKDDDRGGAWMTVRDVTQIENHRAELEQMLVTLRSSRDEISSKNRELRVLADADPLTGCLNRRAFFDEFRKAWKLASQTNLPLSCVMLDVDHFKNVNDQFGHQWGDEILKAVSTVLRKQFADPCLVGRYGGEEFCVMMPNLSIDEAREIAERARLQIAGLRFWDRPELSISASLGVATIGPGVNRHEDLVRQADECLYMAKRNGRNRVVSRDDYRRIALTQAEAANEAANEATDEATAQDDKLDPTSVR